MRISDWSSDVCSSDLGDRARAPARAAGDRPAGRGPAGRGDAVDQRRRLHPGQPRAARGGRPRLRLPELGPMNLMVTRTKPLAMMLRWLTLGAAAGAALTMSLDALGLAGTRQGGALVRALLTVFADIDKWQHKLTTTQ